MLRAGDEIAHRARDEDLVRARRGHDPCGCVHVDPARLAVMDLALADVQTGARLEPDGLGRVSDRISASDRLSRAVEGREEAVAGRVDLMAAVSRELATHGQPVS